MKEYTIINIFYFDGNEEGSNSYTSTNIDHYEQVQLSNNWLFEEEIDEDSYKITRKWNMENL